MRVAIITLGCKVNQSESASIEGELLNNNHEIVKYTDNPDICIVNTCTVTGKSDYRSRQLIRRAVKSGAKVIATGCYAQTRSEELSKINGINLILGNSEKGTLLNYLGTLSAENSKSQNMTCHDDSKPATFINSPVNFITPGAYYSNRARAFLKIQDGCNFTCSYCIVPMARGESRSLNEEEVLKAVKIFHKQGYKEIVITGIHIGLYGLDMKPKSSLTEILKKITKNYPDIRFRLSSIEPGEFRDEIFSMIKENSLCSHLHIPLQSGSDKILKAMNRGYSTVFFQCLINRIASTCHGISIGTDVIAGFPGESETDFRETALFLEKLPLSYIHVFPYSRRPDTKAANMKGHLENLTIKKRVNILLEIAKRKKNDYMKGHLGKYLNVIVENKTVTHGFYRAVSDNYIKTFIRSNHQILGKEVRVKAISLSKGDLLSIPSEEH